MPLCMSDKSFSSQKGAYRCGRCEAASIARRRFLGQAHISLPENQAPCRLTGTFEASNTLISLNSLPTAMCLPERDQAQDRNVLTTPSRASSGRAGKVGFLWVSYVSTLQTVDPAYRILAGVPLILHEECSVSELLCGRSQLVWWYRWRCRPRRGGHGRTEELRRTVKG